MVLTMQAAFEEIENSNEHNFGKMAHSLAHGALMGARGNSGVILSQLWRGFARGIDNAEYLDGPGFVQALASARDTAYKGVVRPVEGTILTVAKDSAAAGEKALAETNDLVVLLERVVQAADISVQHTPQLLPVLMDAGVVDSGGKGLFFIFEGMLRHIQGQTLQVPQAVVQSLATMNLENIMEAIEPGQDYEVVVDFRPYQPLELGSFYSTLEEMGTSIQVGEGDGMYRMHIHVPAEKRYEPIDYTMKLGTILKVAMENLVAQMEDRDVPCGGNIQVTPANIQPGQIAVVAVSPGNGISRVFSSLGAAAIVEGGQTMNPSTQEIISAFENLPTDLVIILPNNKNIILAAKTAAELTVKKVAVIPSRSVPQGLAAMLRLIPDGDLDSVAEDMVAALDDVQTCEITIATRDAEIDGVEVQEGEVIGLYNGKLVLSETSLEKACLGILGHANAGEYELITLFYGSNLPRQEAMRIADLVREAYPGQEIEVQEGCQPHYYLIIAIE
jgi:hypothetical protein